MIIQLQFKTPDVVSDSLDDCPWASDEQRDDAEDVVNKYVKHGEYVTILINTETGEATVEEA